MSRTARGYSYRNSMHGRRPRLNRRDLGLHEHFVEPHNHCAQAAPDSTHGYNMLLSAQWVARRKCDGQVVAVSSTSCFHIVANVPLGRSYNVASTWQKHGKHIAWHGIYHGNNMGCCCHDIAMLLPCYCHAIAMSVTWQQHGNSMATPLQYHVHTMAITLQ